MGKGPTQPWATVKTPWYFDCVEREGGYCERGVGTKSPDCAWERNVLQAVFMHIDTA